MSDLPRVTYSNFDIDLAPVHAQFDALLPSFERRELGQSHRSMIDGVSVNLAALPATITSPIDRNIVVGRVSPATADQVSEAVSAAAARAKSWAATPTAERIRLLRAFARELAKRRFQLALAALFEVGKSRIEAIGEAEEAVDLADYYATQMEERQGYRQALSQVRAGEITESLLLPFGVFAVVAPFNFPIALSVNMLSAALVTGNTVVFKPAPACSLSGRMIVEAALEAGIPPGALNLVLGGAQVGQALVSHPLVAGVAFTGSHDAGMQIARAALSGGYAKPVIAEMGGKNPAYVTAHADLDVAAQGVARSAFGLQGQKCSACSVAYVEEAVKDAFIAKLQAVTATFKLGDPRAVDTFMGAVQSRRPWTVSTRRPKPPGSKVESSTVVTGLPRARSPGDTFSSRRLRSFRRRTVSPRKSYSCLTSPFARPPLSRRPWRKATPSSTVSRQVSTLVIRANSNTFWTLSKRAWCMPIGQAARPPARGPGFKPSAAGKARASPTRAAWARTFCRCSLMNKAER